MNRVNVQKKRKWNNIRTAILIGVATNIIISIIVYAFNYFFKFEPLLEGLNTEIKILCKKEIESDSILHRLESQYLFKDNSGQTCIVGVNPNLEEGYASAYKDNRYGKSGTPSSHRHEDGKHRSHPPAAHRFG